MTISERLFGIMKEQNISMPDLSRMTGISRHTIFDWQRRGTNPGADKIMVLCEALKITPEELLMGTIGASSSGKTTIQSPFALSSPLFRVKETPTLFSLFSRRILSSWKLLTKVSVLSLEQSLITNSSQFLYVCLITDWIASSIVFSAL